ncbi:aldose 1-epimerase family protein [Gaetbulibacter aestuarii]|uniref:Aldose 1-epimerase family protein n=1 Tax=Gaetbulibacter aestuarii TaxID=1502358 RepID=A0ABW7N1U5_9FLAO
MYTLRNALLEIGVKNPGAELCKISGLKTHLEFMWDAQLDIWGSHAPNLFPIIGALKKDSFVFEGTTYSLPKHGMIRNNPKVYLVDQTENKLIFGLDYSEETLKQYPFKFEFRISFTLIENRITIDHHVKNCDSKPLYFSLGGHPAFKCPVFKDDAYSDYFLEFETEETSKTHLINPANGLISNRTKPTLEHTKTLPLTHDLFNEDALIFKDLISRKVQLKSQNHGTILSVTYPDFNYLGIWAKPNGDFVCIEPWLGIADHEDHDQNFKTKEGILTLDSNKTFHASYEIEINKKHL